MPLISTKIPKVMIKFRYNETDLVPDHYPVVQEQLARKPSDRYGVRGLIIFQRRMLTTALNDNLHASGLQIAHIISNERWGDAYDYRTRFLFARDEIMHERKDFLDRVAAFQRFVKGATWDVLLWVESDNSYHLSCEARQAA